jgi:uncharacterized protein YfaS (alpha-2-macroglobulin family)
VSWVDGQGKTLARGESDRDGRVALAERPTGAHVVVARKDGQMSLIALREPALDLAEFDIAGMPYVAGTPVCLQRPQPLPARGALRGFGHRA